MADLLSTMNELKAAIAQHGAATLRKNASPQEIHEFGERLEEIEPFKTVAQKWLVSPMGGGRTGSGLSGRWVFSRMLDGIAPEALIESAQATLAANRYEALEIRSVRGIELADTQALSDTVTLVPNIKLRHSWCHEHAFPQRIGDSYCSDHTAALVHRISIEPAFLDAPNEAWEQAAAAVRQRRADFSALVRLALGLASGGSVQMPFLYCDADPTCLFSEALSAFSQDPTMTFWGVDTEVDIELVRTLLVEFEKMESARALELSVDRLIRSRVFGALENRIIDLGMAAEIALMHSKSGSGDGKGEITNKMANRGAWLIGNDADEREAIAKLLMELYSARSLVVHTGQAKSNLQPRIAQFDELVARIALELLKRGAFPDWKRLVLGG